MYTMTCSEGENFTKGYLSRYGNIELSPAAGVLNYGQGLFEGTKAFRGENGQLCLFRPEQNAIRMQIGAERMCMPARVKEIALANRGWIPPTGKGSLYIRPLLIGCGPILGLAPTPEYAFLIYASPVGNYFKVQYGDTLRRFSSQIVDGKLDLDMNALREKVHSLYSFPVGSELLLTYIDEDKDAVTLADEEDLNDIVRQSLNPLRITVKLNTKRSARSQSKSSGNSTPVREPQVQIPLQVKSTSATEVLNSLPDTVRETILKLSTDLGFDTNSPTGSADLLDSLAQMGLSYLKGVSVSGTKSGPLESSTVATVTKEKNSFLAVGTTQVSEKKRNDTEQNNKSGFSENFVMKATDIENVKDKPSTLSAKTTSDSFNGTGGYKQDKDNNFCLHDTQGNCNTGSSEGNKVGNNARSGHKMGSKKSIESRQWWNHVIGPQHSNNARSGHMIEAKKSIGPRQVWDSEPWNGIESSFSNFPSVNKLQHPHGTVPFKRSSNPSDGISRIFHSGVRCDGCGVYPISGPRFKSIMMEDYDLCSICFAGIGTKAGYIRMDHPVSYKDPMQQYCLGRPSALPADQSKLDSCFIQDVNILDGTIMSPSTRFTKVWRMRNNGSVVWPHGTHLVWIGGIMFSKALSCGIEIPADGCPVDKEIDIAVDFTAPVHPGRYVSYWRMSTPSGHKFGQRVWVLIQVNSSLKDPLSENAHGFNLNWPPVSGGVIMDYQDKSARGNPIYQDSLFKIENYGNYGKAIMEHQANTPKKGLGFSLPTDSTLLGDGAKPNSALLEASLPVKYPAVDLSEVEPVSVPHYSDAGVPSSMVGVGQGKDEVEKTLLQELSLPTDSTLLGEGAKPNSALLEASLPVKYPAVDLSKVEPVSVPHYSDAGVPSSVVGVGQGKDEVEKTLLQELEEMGFKQVDFNKKLLRNNDYDLEQTLNDLCAWDHVLEDLQ